MLPKIRTITGFISTNDLEKLDSLIEKLKEMKFRFQKSGYEVQTLRITTDILENLDDCFDAEKFFHVFDILESDDEITVYHAGSISSVDSISGKEGDFVKFLLKYKKLYKTVNLGVDKTSKEICLLAAKICKEIAEIEPFACKSFAAHAGVTTSTPFYPASRVFENSMKFAIGLQSSNLAVEEATKCRSTNDLQDFEASLLNRMETEYRKVESLLTGDQKKEFIGFDTSLAPFPSDDFSIANAIEIYTGRKFGLAGTLSTCRLLTRVMQENEIQRTGLCGLMLPVIEDNILAKRGIEGLYDVNSLLCFSSVCATGIDTVPISGATTVNQLANSYLDLATLAIKLKKPLSARYFVEVDKLPGDTVKYNWDFACESPIFMI